MLFLLKIQLSAFPIKNVKLSKIFYNKIAKNA